MTAMQLRRQLRDLVLEAISKHNVSSNRAVNMKVGVSFKYGGQQQNALVDIDHASIGVYRDGSSITPVVWIVLDQADLDKKLKYIDGAPVITNSSEGK